MLKICICDDDVIFSSLLEKYILDYINRLAELEVEIDIYDNGISLLKAVIDQHKVYQIAFLDIEMQTINGIDTAKKIRLVDNNLYIIYITSFERYTLESFQIRPFRYLLKPIKKNEIHSILELIIKEITANKQYLFFKSNHVQYQIKCDDIISIKSEKGRMIHLNITKQKDSLIFYEKIKMVEKKLNPLLFVKVNPGTIVNLNYVNIITNNEIKMENKEVFPISRGQKQVVKTKYNLYLEWRLNL